MATETVSGRRSLVPKIGPRNRSPRRHALSDDKSIEAHSQDLAGLGSGSSSELLGPAWSSGLLPRQYSDITILGSTDKTMPSNSDGTEAQVKAELHVARVHFEEARRQFAEAKELYNDIGLGNQDGSFAVLRANQAYVDAAMAGYRDALERWNKLVLGRKPWTPRL